MRTFLNYLVLLIFLAFLSFGYYYYYNNKKNHQEHSESKGMIDSNGSKITHDIVETDHSNFVTKDEVSGIIKNYIEQNPQIIIKSVEKHMKGLADKERSKAIDLNKDLLENQLKDPKFGPSDAKFKVIEFFDYSCSFCKMMAEQKGKLLNNEKDVYYIFKETPILGSFSIVEAKVSISVYNLDKQKYLPFHFALLKSRGIKTEEDLINLAVSQGINRADLEKLMASSELNKVIQNNISLARKIGISGTPAYIINGKLHEGALSYNDIMKMLGKDGNSPKAVANEGNYDDIPARVNNTNNKVEEPEQKESQEEQDQKEAIEVPAPPMPPAPPQLSSGQSND